MDTDSDISMVGSDDRLMDTADAVPLQQNPIIGSDIDAEIIPSESIQVPVPSKGGQHLPQSSFPSSRIHDRPIGLEDGSFSQWESQSVAESFKVPPQTTNVDRSMGSADASALQSGGGSAPSRNSNTSRLLAVHDRVMSPPGTRSVPRSFFAPPPAVENIPEDPMATALTSVQGLEQGYIHRITIDDFKSYEGHHALGPFLKFSCVVGSNGSGKSNLMDAISFALGVQSKILRGEKMEDLIFSFGKRFGDATEPLNLTTPEGQKRSPTSAKVEIVFKRQDEMYRFSREITPAGSIYRVNDRVVPFSEYQEKLEEVNILPKVRNFLVFQGDVQNACMKSNDDVMELFERVSGSEQFKGTCKRLDAEIDDIKERMTGWKTRRQELEKMQKGVKKELDLWLDFTRTKEDQERRKSELHLCGLYCATLELNICEDSIKELGKKVADVSKIKKMTEEYEEEKLAHAKAEQDVRRMTLKLDETKCEAEKDNPKFSKIKIQAEICAEKVKTLTDRSRKAKELDENATRQITECDKDEARILTLLEQFAKVREKTLPLDPIHLREFERIKASSVLKTASTQDVIRDFDREITALGRELAQMTQQVREKTNLKEYAQSKVDALNAECAAVKEAMDKAVENARDREKSLENLTEMLRTSLLEKDKLLTEREEILELTDNAEAYEKEREREQRLSSTVKVLKQVVPEVYGRVLDLCTVRDPQNRAAINAALGPFLDCVLCDATDTALRCCEYLKRHKLSRIMILPIKSMRKIPDVRALGEKVRSCPVGSLTLALECITYKDQYDKGFKYMLGHTVFVDTFQSACRIAYGDFNKYGTPAKVVTLEGELIKANGNIVINTDLEARNKFDMRKMQDQQRELTRIEEKIGLLTGHLMVVSEKKRALEIEIANGGKLDGSVANLARLEKELNYHHDDIARINGVLASVEPELETLAQKKTAKEKQKQRAETASRDSVKKYFEKLNAASGKDVWALDRSLCQEKKLAKDEAEKLQDQLNFCRMERGGLQRSKAKLRAEEVRKELKDSIKEGQKLEAQVNEMEPMVEARTGMLHQLKADLDARKAVATEKNADALKRRQTLVTARENNRKREIEMLTKTREMELKCSDVLKTMQGFSVNAGEVFFANPLEFRRGSIEVVADFDGTNPLNTWRAVEVDFAAVPDDFRNLDKDHQTTETIQMRNEVQGLSARLQEFKGNVNPKAPEQAQKVDDDLGEVMTRLNEALQLLDEKNALLDTINTIYNKMRGRTKNTKRLFFSLEQPSQPFSGGIKFTAKLPGSKFRSVSELSGGEQAMVALCLVFAIQEFKKPPFLVLDEVDASLDVAHVQNLVKYLATAPVQTITISLKDQFYSVSDALIGVYKQGPTGSSSVVQLHLGAYSNTEPEN
eukprot:GEMP01001179.1.p1 GENE.GEMP01001179.1~~GEMP01001179.1.p1  ORF type:complete len:1386 (+),score=283.43 GEMP01001179.1:118-4275(+)